MKVKYHFSRAIYIAPAKYLYNKQLEMDFIFVQILKKHQHIYSKTC